LIPGRAGASTTTSEVVHPVDVQFHRDEAAEGTLAADERGDAVDVEPEVSEDAPHPHLGRGEEVADLVVMPPVWRMVTRSVR
jgi:hypothetical protein